MNQMNQMNLTAKTLDKIAEMAERLPRPCLIALDGRCASGKSTLAGRLGARKGWQVFHMDDFFLRPEQRTEQRLATPGGNVDHERFLAEVLLPLRQGRDTITYRPFDCAKMTLAHPIRAKAGEINLIEGSYSGHPALWSFYDLHLFLTVNPEEQMQRILSREGEAGAVPFREKWIPMEERYFSAFQIMERCELCVSTDSGKL